jgi:NhaP-type Na+/H+ or K+/H+ antiporter
MEADAIGIGTILALGIGAQWLGRAIGFPSILVLLIAGVLAGPVLGVVDPDEIFGESLFPVISLGVGLLLFEEGMKLHIGRLPPGTRRPVVGMLTIGASITGAVAAVAAWRIFGLDSDQAAVLGAVVIVSGPTVVGPILQIARPREPVNSILSFEGIITDPVGAMIGIAVLNVAVADHGPGLIMTAGLGLVCGLAGAAVLVLAMRLLLVPDDLEVAVAVGIAVVVFTVAEEFRDEAGLFATTVMGIALANQRRVPMERVREFGGTLGAVVLGSLFIVLAARVDLGDVVEFLPEALLFTAFLIVAVRPLATMIALYGTHRPFAEKVLIAGIAPRGVVAAATSSLFLLKFQEVDESFPELVPVVFTVIFATAAVYGLSAPLLTRILDLYEQPPRGVAILGGQPWAIDLARCLAEQRVPVILLTDRPLPADQVPDGVEAVSGDVDGEAAREALAGVGRTLVTAQSTDRRQLAGSLLTDRLGRESVRVIAPPEEAPAPVRGLRASARRLRFVEHRGEIEAAYERGARFAALETVPEGTRPLLVIDAEGYAHLHRRPRGKGVRSIALVGGAADQPPAPGRRSGG